MTGLTAPRIGVVTDSSLHLFEIQSVLKDSGYEVAGAYTPDKINDEALVQSEADAWVVSLSVESDCDEVVSLMFDLIDVPILLDENAGDDDEDEDRVPWQKRLMKKLAGVAVAGTVRVKAQAEDTNPILSEANRAGAERQVARNVWVLGASLGGPEAVVEFLQQVPVDLPVSFVYAQHIDAKFCQVLAEAIDKNTPFEARVLGDDDVLTYGQVGIVPVESELKFLPMGKVVRTGKPWSGPFAPAIDQVINDVASVYADCAGTIIFSGMGDDGAKACDVMRQQGGAVWAQSPDHCISPHMPEAALAGGRVEFNASPAELAVALVQRYAANSVRQEQT